MTLTGKVALVTGGGRGIGETIAQTFAREGAAVAVAARTRTEVEAAADRLRRSGARAVAVAGDVSNAADVARMVDEAVAALGPIDILVNAAGVLGPVGPLAENDPQEWLDSMHINVGGAFLASRSVLPAMIARRSGKIINLSGGGATGPRPFFSAYSAAKAAVVRLTECLAHEVAEFGIQVNAIAPGACNTRMFDQMVAAKDRGGAANARDVEERLMSGGVSLDAPAALALYLASSDSSWMTGRLLSAVHDDWKAFASRSTEISSSDAYTLRRLDTHTLRQLNRGWSLPGE